MKNKSGSAILIVLSVLVGLSFFGMSLLNTSGDTTLFWKKQKARQKALYLAESGLQLGVWDFSNQSGKASLEVDSTPSTDLGLMLAPERSPSVEIREDGYWLKIISTGIFEKEKVMLTGLFAQELHRGVFRPALRLGSSKTIAGLSQMQVEGVILQAGKGTQKDSSQQKQQGASSTSVSQSSNNKRFGEVMKVMTEAVQNVAKDKKAQLDSLFSPIDLADSPKDIHEGSLFLDAEDLKSYRGRLVMRDGDLVVDYPQSGSFQWRGPKKIFVFGNVTIQGPVDISNLKILTTGSITLDRGVHGAGIDLFAEERILLGESCKLEASITAGLGIDVGDEVVLGERSVLAVSGPLGDTLTLSEGPAIRVSSMAKTGGWIFVAGTFPQIEDQLMQGADILLEAGAVHTGMVMTMGSLFLEGEVIGSVSAMSLGCFSSPNCAGGGRIDRAMLSPDFLQPPALHFGGERRMIRTSWDES